MNIIFGDNISALAREKYTVLELDTFLIESKNQTATAYAVLEHVPLDEMDVLPEFVDLHQNLMAQYRNQNWKYCEDAIGTLTGRWQGELDTFYGELHDRIQELKNQSLDAGWAGLVIRSA